MGERHLIIGGNAAGMTAASRAKRLAPSLDITVIGRKNAGPDRRGREMRAKDRAAIESRSSSPKEDFRLVQP